MKCALVVSGSPDNVVTKLRRVTGLALQAGYSPEDCLSVFITEDIYSRSTEDLLDLSLTREACAIVMPFYRSEFALEELAPLIRDCELVILSEGSIEREILLRASAEADAPCLAGVFLSSRDEEGALLAETFTSGETEISCFLLDGRPAFLQAGPYAEAPELPEPASIHSRIISCVGGDPLLAEDFAFTLLPSDDGIRSAEFVIVFGKEIEGDSALALDLAARLGAAPAVTYAARELMDAPVVGPGGARIAPRLLILCAEDCGPEFLHAADGAGKIVAVSKDPAAPLMRKADVSVVSDWRVFLKELAKAKILDELS